MHIPGIAAPAVVSVILASPVWATPFSAWPQDFTQSARDQKNGMREADVRWDCLTNARVVVRPGTVLENATVILRDGWIESVAVGAPAPQGAAVHDLSGKTIYAGLIDLNIPVSTGTQAAQAASARGAHWNPRVTPQVDANTAPVDSGLAGELRALGFTAVAARPTAGIFRGESRLQLLESPGLSAPTTIDARLGQSIAMERGEFDWDAPDADARARSVTFPGSQMGTVALLRQTLSDARWALDAQRVWENAPAGDEPPTVDAALLALLPLARGDEPLWLHAGDEQQLLRLAKVAAEAGARAAVLGSGKEFKRLSEVAATGLDVVVPLSFPATPEVNDPRLAEQIPLAELKEWAIAPANPALLVGRGVRIAITTDGLAQRNQFPERARQAMEAGLTHDQLLGALTTDAAAMAGVDSLVGTVEAGKLANLVVIEGGPILSDGSRVTDVWVAGRKHEIARAPAMTIDGACTLVTGSGFTRDVEIKARDNSITILEPQAEADGKPKEPKRIGATHVTATPQRVVFQIPTEAMGLPQAEGQPIQTLRCAAIIDGGIMHGVATTLSGEEFAFMITPKAAIAASDTPPASNAPSPAAAALAPAPEPKKLLAVDPSTVPLTTPIGAYGVESLPEQETVVFENATVWTSGPQGRLEKANVVVHHGKVVAVGPGASMPGARVVDATGKHITPGMIDCHSHTGVEGGVNEFTQVCTAEVRVSDVIDPDDINWYRELAGGLTAANQLHGSANPIGGQNSVVKLRWGAGADDFPATGFKPGMKWALGENVVRSENRYPNTRMGVEAYLRDRLTAARQYRAAMEEWSRVSGTQSATAVPPRRDLELEALAQIVAGERIIHCHSYRQDEILMLLRLAEEFGFRIGTLQHVLEGYKVAEVIAAHGAGASCFTDWWAYKMEVMDAIPYAGSIMHDQGVVVSFNSDSDELARRMNLECAKAVRYGGLDEPVALQFTTINPAKQLGIASFTGSLEPGKDADFVVWSGDPLATSSRCEETWIDGACYFSLDKDRALRTRDRELRTRLIAAAASGPPRPAGATGAGGNGGEGGDRPRGRRGRPGVDGPSGPAPTAPTLLSRMLEERENQILEDWRAGRAIEQSSQGVCGN